jgi:hypothetical protein
MGKSVDKVYSVSVLFGLKQKAKKRKNKNPKNSRKLGKYKKHHKIERKILKTHVKVLLRNPFLYMYNLATELYCTYATKYAIKQRLCKNCEMRKC